MPLKIQEMHNKKGEKTMKNKVYKKYSWSWFYKNFVKNTVNDNFYTAAEIMSKKSDIIQKAKNFNINRKINRNNKSRNK